MATEATHRLTVYHGAAGDLAERPEAWRWWTTDPDHAAHFGDVTRRQIVLRRPLRIDARRAARILRGGGWEADARLYARAARLFRRGYDALLVEGWEGRGLVVLLREAVEVSRA